MREKFLPFALPSIGEEEIQEVVDSLRSGWITTGPKTKQFEERFREYVGSRHAIAVNSCTAALHVALSALGVGPGDEVIVPTLTFCSTANVVVHLGARPVIVDVGGDFLVQAETIAQAITPRTKVIVPVHFAGQVCEMDAIRAIAGRHGLPVLEDAAHAVGAEYRGRKVGSLGTVTAFSFYAIKNLTTGEGGMITTDDDALAEKMRRLSLHGMSRDAWKRYGSAGSWSYEVTEAGYKDNMTDVQASLGLHQLRRLDGFIDTRSRYAAAYKEAFRRDLALECPIVRAWGRHAWHLFVVRLSLERLTIDRDRFVEELRSRNIGTSVHFIPVHLHPYYRERFGYRPGDLPSAEGLFRRILSLPLYPAMREEDLKDVVDAVKDVARTFERV